MLSGYALADTYSVLTRLPDDARLVPSDAGYDGLVGAAAHAPDLALATRDARARATYEALGVTVQVLS